MTNAELIQKIRAEIERRKKRNKEEYAPDGLFEVQDNLAKLLSFLDTLESEKPMNLEKMEREEELKKAVHQVSEEIVKEIFPDDLENGDFFTEVDLKNCITRVAYQFADWGAEHAKIDVTDFCKPIDPGIAQCIADHFWEMLGEDEKPVPNDLEEAAAQYARDYTENDEGNGGDDWEDDIRITFEAGAKWQKEQYHFFNKAWAEKDLALTWEDMKTIEQIIATSDWYDFEINGKLWSQEFYEEVLKRFKEAKK